jgi:hypothetical protein
MLKWLVIDDYNDKGVAKDIINEVIYKYSNIVEVSLCDIKYIKHNYATNDFDMDILIHNNILYSEFALKNFTEKYANEETYNKLINYNKNIKNHFLMLILKILMFIL